MSKNETSHGIGKTVTKVAAASGLVAIFGAAAAVGAPSAIASSTAQASASGDVATQVRKSVTLTGAPDGTINSSASAMVTQVSAVGNGQSTVRVPVGADSARNLDGFSSVSIQNQEAIFNLNPNGNEEQRIYTKSSDGPLRVKATATLDGKPINPGEVVNKTGVLAVNYTVINTETQKETVTYKDARGNDVTQEVEVASPIGGSVEIILPPGFNEVTAPTAQVGGDGTGATKLSYSLVLFEPLGNRVANFGYQTRIQEGTLPKATFTFLPIVPLENSTIKSTKEAYEGGASTGSTIFGAGVEIGENLLKIQDGAAQLVEGLQKATDGAGELADGLNNTAVPGANKLAAGSAELSNGADTLASGLSGDFADGMAELSAGLKKLQAGVNALPEGVKAQLEDNEEYQAAIYGLNVLVNGGPVPGVGTIPSPTTAKAGVDALYNVANTADPGTCAALPGFGTCATAQAAAKGYVDFASTLGALLGDGLPDLIDQVLDGIQAQLLGTPEAPGINALAAGGAQLNAALTGTVIPGANALAAGASQVADGNATLATGLETAADGASQIADGLPAAVDGTQQIESGSEQLRVEGADKLASSGETAQADYAYKVAQINALQQIGLSGSNIPYGPAEGPNTETTGVYQLVLTPASTGASNGLVFGLAALGLVVAGAAGVLVWRRVH